MPHARRAHQSVSVAPTSRNARKFEYLGGAHFACRRVFGVTFIVPGQNCPILARASSEPRWPLVLHRIPCVSIVACTRPFLRLVDSCTLPVVVHFWDIYHKWMPMHVYVHDCVFISRGAKECPVGRSSPPNTDSRLSHLSVPAITVSGASKQLVYHAKKPRTFHPNVRIEVLIKLLSATDCIIN